MASSHQNIFFFAAFLLYCSFFVVSVSLANNVSNSRELIGKLCDSVKDPRFCRSTLIPYPPARAAQNATALALAAIDIGISFAEDTQRFILDEIKKRDHALRKCVDVYGRIAEGLETAVWDLMMDGDPKSASYDVVAMEGHTKLVMDMVRRGEAKEDAFLRTLVIRTKRMVAYLRLAAAAVDFAEKEVN